MSHTSLHRASYHLRARNILKRRLGLEKLEERALLAARVWDGEGADGNWSTAKNWAGDIAPLAGDDLIFAPLTGQLNITNDFASGTTFNTITLSGSGYTIGGNALNLYGGLAANNVTGNNTFDIDVTLINGQSIVAANPQATLTFAGDINTANLIGTTFIFGTSGLTLDGAGNLNITGVISGAASLTKLGAGTATLSGNNSYEGITDVRQGVLVANNNQALGNALTGETQVQAGAALHVSGGRAIAEALAIREGGVGFGAGQDGSSLGALRSIGGNNTWTGGIELAADNNLIGVDAGSLLNITGVIAKGTSVIGGRRFIKVGDGTLRLSGSAPNLYAGETLVLNGTLELNKPAGVNAIGGSLIIGDQFSGDNAAVVRLLASSQIPQTDVVDVGLTTVTINSAGRLEFASSSIVETIGNLVLFTGPTYSADIDLNGGTLTLGGASLTLSQFQGSSGVSPAATIADGTLDLGTFFSGAGGGFTKTFSISDTQIPNVATDLNISARIVGDANASVTMTGSGTLQLGGNNSFAGPFLQTNGIVEVASNTAFGTGLISLQNSANVLRPIGAARTISNPISLDGNISTIGEFDLTFSGAITLSDNRTVLVMEPNQTVTFAAPVGEGIYGSRNLVKAGRGTLALTAANTYSGSTTTNSDGGTLVLSGNGSILNTSLITIGIASTLRLDNTAGNLNDRLHDLTSINNNGRLHFIGSATADSSEKVGPLAPVQNVQSIVEVENRSGGAFASLLTANALTVGGDRPTRFVGTGLPLSATGKNRLSFTNNPAGLDDGILPQALVFGPGGAIDFVTYDTSAEGVAIIPLPAEAYVTDLAQAGVTSNVRLSSSVTLANSKSVNALLIDPGVTIAGDSATLTINSGSLRMGAGSAIRTSYLNIGSGFVTVDGGTATISAAIYSGTIQKGGAGTLILSGDNQHSGSTNINEGVLRIQHSNALGSPAGGTAVRSNAAIELEQTTFGPINVGLESLGNLDGTGGFTNAGALRNLAGNNSWAGTIGLGGNATNLLGVLGGFTVLNSNNAFMQATTGTTFTLTGDLTGGVDLVTLGGGTIEMAGVISRGQDRNNRILEGTLLLNNSPGIQASRGRYFVGTNLLGAPSATLRLGGSDQIIDDRGVEVFASGLFDLAGNSDVIAGNLNLYVAAGGAGQVNIGNGGTLIVNGNTQVLTQGAGHAVGAAITQGTFALQLFGTVATPGTRTLVVNDGAVGADLTITSAIVDGTGLQSVGLIKNGFGELVLAGNTANTFTGLTTVNEGTLTLSKTSGNAIGGALTIGDNNPQSGYSGSDLVRLTQPNQLPDYVASIIINTTGRLSLQGNDDTIGNTDGQTAVTMQAASSIDTGAGELSINGNIFVGVANGATLWTPIAAVTISGNLNLGGVLRDISVQDRSELPADLILAANVRGSGGFRKVQQGDNQPATIQLSGNNSGLTGDVIYSVVGGNQPGVLAIGSDNALGGGRVITAPNAALVGYGGAWSVGNDFLIPTSTMTFGGGGSANGWGGGNDLTLTGAVNLTGGTTTFNMPVATTVNFAGGIGESFGTISQSGSALTKSGFGRMAISAPALVSGAVTISDQGGHLILRDQGTLRNANITVGYGAVLEVDKSIGNHPDQLNSLNQGTESLAATVTLSGGTLALVGKPGEASTETIGAVIIANDRNGAIQSLVSPLAGSSADWRIYSVLRASTSVGANAAGGQQHQGAFVNFVARGTDFQTTGANRLNLTAPELLMSGILPYAVVTTTAGSLEFASYQNLSPATTPYNNVIQALPTTSPTYATSFTGATLASNVKLSGGTFNPESIGQVVNAVLLVNGSTISGPAFTVRSGLVAAQGANNQILANASFGPAVNSNYNSIEAMFYVAAGSELTVSGNITENALALPTNLSKAGAGRLTLAGDNDYIGITRLADGILQATHSNAFGRASVANDVQIQYGATVELANNITIPATKRALARGSGEATTGNVPLRNLSGTTTWLGGVDLQNNRTGIYVDSGSKLILNAITNQPFNKLGAGTLQLSGGASGGGSIVWQGILELAKVTGNVINSITIGDHVGLPGADQLIQLLPDQIVDTQAVTIHSSGRWDLNNQNEAVNGVTLAIGPNSTANIAMGSGVLTTLGNITVNVIAGGTPAPLVLSGTLALQASTGVAATRTITVNDSGALDDVIITANIIDGDDNANLQGLTKGGIGRLVLNPTVANTYTGITTISSGELRIRSASALGDTTSGTIVNSANNNSSNNGTLVLDAPGGLTIVGETLRLDTINNNGNNGAGQLGSGALRNLSGNSTWQAAVTLNSDNTANFANVTIDVDAGQLIIDGVISQSGITVTGIGLIKLGEGALEFRGAQANTYGLPGTGAVGLTTVAQGTLRLNKSAGVAALNGRIDVGNNAGGADADRLVWLADNQFPDQLNVANALLVAETTGLIDLNGRSETVVGPTVNSLFTRQGTMWSGHIDLNGGTLTLGDGTNAVGHWGAGLVGGGFSITISPAGLIEDGTLVVAANNAAWDSGADLFAAVETQVSATISNTGTGRIFKQGAGTLAVTGNNAATYTNVTTNLNAGSIAVGHNNALGGANAVLNVTAATNLLAMPDGPTVVPAQNITLNADLTLRGNAGLTLGGVVSGAGAANRALNLNVNSSAAVVLSGGINLSNDATARTFSINNNTYNHEATVSGVIANGSGGTHLLQKGGVGTAVLTNTNNSFAGQTIVAGGILRVTTVGALGTTAGNTQVNAGFSLQVLGGLTFAEPLSLNGNGLGNFGALQLIDNDTASQTTQWTGNITFAGGAMLRVEDGGATPDTLDLGGGSAALISGDQTLIKIGAGILSFTGTGVNTLNTIEVREGEVQLNKTGAGTSFDTGLTVGDGGGGDNIDRLTLLGANQIPGVTATVGGSGLLHLNDQSDVIGALALQRFGRFAGDVETGIGTLTLGGDITVSNAGVTGGTTPASRIAGLLALNGNRTFTVNDSFALDSAEDLVVAAIISGAANNLTKAGYGTLALTSANTYSGSTTINAATLEYNTASTNNGLNVLVGGTLVLRGEPTSTGSIASSSSITVNSGATLTIDNALDIADRIGNSAGVTIAGGLLRLLGNANSNSSEDIGTLTINAGANTGTISTISLERATAGVVTELFADALARGAGGLAHFLGVGDNLGATTDNRLQIAGGTTPFFADVLAWGTISGPAGFDLVTDADGASPSSPYYLGRVTNYSTDVNAGGIVRLSGGTQTLTANRVVDALLLEGNATIDGPFTLQMGAGSAANQQGLIVVNGGNSTLAPSLLDFDSPANPREALVNVRVGSLAIASTIDASNGNALRKEGVGALTLSGDNDTGVATGQLASAIVVNAGTLTISHEDALGTEPGGSVTINRRAALTLNATTSSLTLGNKAISLNGYGLNDNYTGALRTIGANLITIGTGATVFTLSTETVIDVGTDNTLVLNANVSGNNTLTKRGGGTLEFTGTADNASTGLRSVNEGTLRLNKTANNIQAVDNTLTINDLGNFDGVGSALVIYSVGAANDQIDNNDAVIINTNGRLDFNGGTDQLGAITVAGGTLVNSAGGGAITSTGVTINGGGIATGTGTLTVNGNITYTAGLSAGAAPTIAGNLNLGGDVRSFTINDGPWVDDLVIDAQITNGRLLKLGNGALGLTHSGNTFNLANVDEVQTVTVPATVTTFTLTFNGYTTAAITRATDTAATIQAFLEALPSIGAGNVLVSGAVAGPYTVTFQGALAATNVAALTAAVVTGTGTITLATTVAGQSAAASEVQLVTVPVTVTAFTLTFDTVASAAIANPATPAAVRAALELIPSIGAGNVLVSGSTGGPYIIQFVGALAGVNVSALTAATTAGTGTITIATPTSGQAAVELQAGTVAIASPTALGGASTQINVSGNVTLRPLGVDLVGVAAIANPIHYQTFISNTNYTDVANNRTLTLGGRRDFGGTWGIELSGQQLQRTASALNGQTQSIAIVDPLVSALISGEIAGGNANLQFRKEGLGTLAFAGNNSYQGATIINQGILIARSNNAMGSVNQGTTLTSGAELQLANVAIGNEALTLSGNGYQNRNSTAAMFTGALHSLPGNSSWGTDTTLITLASNPVTMNTEAGTLTLNAVIAGGANGLNKVGAGTLELAGSNSNTYTNPTTVLDGKLRLNKSGAATAILGTLNIGDNLGADDSDQVVYAATAGNNQVGDVVVNVNTTGVLNLGVVSDVYAGTGTLNWVIGQTASADVITSTGNVLSTAYNVTVRPGITNSVPATSIGVLNLGSSTKVFTIGDAPGEIDFLITAQLTENVANVGVTKAGVGRMLLNPTAASTFTGVVTVSAGVLRVQGSGALGTANATPGSGTVVSASAAVLELASANITGESLQLFGNGFNILGQLDTDHSFAAAVTLGSGALRAMSGNNLWDGPIELRGNDGTVRTLSIGADAGASLNLSNVISQNSANHTLVKVGAGEVEFSGSSSNTYLGVTYVASGTLKLNKQGGALAIQSAELYIGDTLGGDNADRLVYGSFDEQLLNPVIHIASTGLFDLNGRNETLTYASTTNNFIALGVGASASADLLMQGGTLTTNGVPAAIGEAGPTTGAWPAATIVGNWTMSNAAATQLTFDIRDTPALVELEMQGVLAGPAGGGITKAGRGALAFSGGSPNTFDGPLQFRTDAGSVVVAKDGALGTINGGTFVTMFSSLIFAGNFDYTQNESIVVTGTGIDGLNEELRTGALVSRSGTQTFAGTITLGGAVPQVLFSSAAGNLTFTNVTPNAFRMGTTGLAVTGAGEMTILGPITGADPAPSGSGLMTTVYGLVPSPNLRLGAPDLQAPPAILESIYPAAYGVMPQINFGNTAGNPFSAIAPTLGVDDIAAIWKGQITIPEDGLYRFTTSSDDGSMLFIDGMQVMHSNFNQGLVERGGDIYLTAGTHEFYASVYDRSSSVAMIVTWELLSGATFAKVAIPAAAFTFATNNTLTKLGEGTLTLRGANTYAGVTNIEDGTLRVNDVADGGVVSNLGTNSVINISGAGTLSYDGTATDAMNRTINLDLSAGADSPRIDVAIPTGELQLTNAIINGVGETLGKTGAGLLTLAGTTSATLANLFAAGGTLTLQDASTVLVSDTTTVGADAFYIQQGDSGTLNIRDNATLTTGQLVLGANNGGPEQTNVLNQTGGTVTITSKAADSTALRIGHGANTTNTYNLSGGILTLTDPAAQIASGGDGAGAFMQTGGSASAAGVIVNYLDANGSGNFTLTSGTFSLGAEGFSTVGGPAVVNLGGAGPLLIATASSSSAVPINLSGQGASALKLDTNGNTVTLAGNITGSGALNKVGAGTLALDGTNTFAGPTIVNAGTLAGNGSLTSAVDLSSTATIAPGGGSPGDLTTGTLTLVTGSTLQAQINGVTPGTGYDQLVVVGDVHLSNATLDLNLTGVYPGATTFVLLQNDGAEAIDGTFLNLPELSVITLNGQAFRITYRYNAEAVPGELGTGNDVALVRNQAPVAQDDNYSMTEGGVLNGTSVLANDSDPDGEPLQGAILVTPPAVGNLNFNTTTGAFIYTPPTNFAGSVTFVYRARDIELASNDATVTIVVDGVADAPIITVSNASGLEDTNIPLAISVVALNPATEVISSIIISNVPNLATLSHGVKLPNGTWSLTVADLTGLTIRPATHSDVDFVMLVTATVTEGSSPPASAQQSLPVNITAVADTPILTVPSAVTGLESTNSLDAVALGIAAQLVDTDFPFPNSETLSVRIAGVPSDATIVGGVNLGAGVWQLAAANIAGAKLLKSDNGVFTLTVTATSTENDPLASPRTATTAPKQIQVTINNDLPLPKLDDVVLLGSSLGPLTQIGIVPGLPLTLMVSTTDPAGKNVLGNDADAPFNFVLNWGDNSPPSTGTANAEGLSPPFSHNYGTNGTFTIALKVTDKDGGARTVTLATVNAAQIVTSGDVLYVGGTNLGDRIIVSLSKGISIRLNNTTYSGLDASRVVIFGNGGNDTISTTSSQLPVEFYGGAGDDYLSGGSQIDTLDGGAGRDRLFGYAADDVLLGGPGNDNIFGGTGDDYHSGDDFIDIAGGTLLPDGTRSFSGQIINLGDAGADNINGEAGHDTLMGNAGNDRLIGGLGNDYLNGGTDTDNIDGSDGNDFLYGGLGSDVLYGRAGADILIGGQGTDSLYGGAITDLLYGGDIDSSLLDPLDDTNLRAIWESWASADFQTAVDWLAPYAQGHNDHNRDSVHGEGDADWYLMFLAYLDVYRISTEGKTPNKTIYLDA